MKRFEKKYTYLDCYHNLLLAKLLSIGFVEIYSPRNINSIYYENKEFDLYQQSIDGLANRLKYRIRFYDNDIKNLQLEKKIRTNEYGLKKISKVNNENSISLYIFDPFLKSKTKISIPKDISGIYNPILITKYRRNYFALREDHNCKLTLDRNIRFGSLSAKSADLFKACINVPFGSNVMEMKSNSNNEYFSAEIIKQLDFIYHQNERISKYCNAVEVLF